MIVDTHAPTHGVRKRTNTSPLAFGYPHSIYNACIPSCESYRSQLHGNTRRQNMQTRRQYLLVISCDQDPLKKETREWEQMASFLFAWLCCKVAQSKTTTTPQNSLDKLNVNVSVWHILGWTHPVHGRQRYVKANEQA